MKRCKNVLSMLMLFMITISCFSLYSFEVSAKSSYISNKKDKSIWIECSTENTENSSVRWYTNDNQNYYLFLPSTANLNNIKLYHTFSGDITINDVTVSDGDTINFLKDGENYTVKADNNTYNLYVMQGSEIPTVFITTKSKSMDYIHQNKENKEEGTIFILNANGTVEYNGNLTHIKGRGNTTWNRDKKPYNIKLENATDLMNMGKSKNWCLMANAQDATMLRNKTMYDLADYIGLEYSPKSCMVDLYANGEYLGVYQLCQKVELGKNNLIRNIYNLESSTESINDKQLNQYPKYNASNKKGYKIENNPSDISGGYLLEYVPSIESESGFNTTRNQSVDIKSPKYASVEQVKYISSYIQDMEDAIYSSNGYNNDGKHYSEYIDIESFAKAYLIQEFSKNVDSCITSCYFYKDTDANGGKLVASPVWDFDVALGNLYSKWIEGKEYTLYNADGWWAKIAPNDTANNNLTIFAQLCTHEDFNIAVENVWQNIFKKGINILLGNEKNDSNTELKSINDYSTDMIKSVEMNYKRWSVITLVNSGGTYNDNITYLKNFTQDRYSFININYMPVDEAISITKSDLENFYNSLNDSCISDIDAVTSIRDKAFEDISKATNAEDIIVIKNNAIDDMRKYIVVTAYFDNSETQWEKVYIYYWDGSEDKYYDWPGIEMIDCGDNIYRYTICGDCHLIFNNGNNAQTVDINNVEQSGMIYKIDMSSQQDGGNKFYYSGTWESYKESEGFIPNNTDTSNNDNNNNNNIDNNTNDNSKKSNNSIKYVIIFILGFGLGFGVCLIIPIIKDKIKK